MVIVWLVTQINNYSFNKGYCSKYCCIALNEMHYLKSQSINGEWMTNFKFRVMFSVVLASQFSLGKNVHFILIHHKVRVMAIFHTLNAFVCFF